MREYLPFIVTGITSGSIYGLAAVGLVLTYKTSGIFNFAHGAQAALAAYIMYQLWVVNGLPWPLAALISLLLAGVVAGLILERMAYALAATSVAARVAATVGLLVAIQGALVLWFGGSKEHMEFFLPTTLVRLPGVNVRAEQIIVATFVLVAVVGLYFFFTRAKIGLAMQAVVDDPNLLALQALSPVAARRFAWLIGSCFASISGMLLAPAVDLDVFTLTLLVFFGFGAAAVGSFSSLPITYLGGLALGLGAALLTKFINSTGPIAALPANLPFVVLFVALLVTPKHRLVERGAQVVRRALPPITFSRRVAVPGVAALAVAALVVPHVVGTRLPQYTTALAYMILFASLSLLVRMSGQISLCHMAFAAVGATTAARAAEAGVPWPVALLLAGLVAVPIGALVAIPAIRLSGVYLAIATFGFGLLVQRIFYPSFLMFGRTSALPAGRPRLGGLHSQTDVGYYHVALAATVVCCVLIVALRRARLGRLLRAFADAPTAVDAHGTNTNELKVLVFCASAFLAGIAGALIGPVTGTATVASFDASVSLLLVAVLFVAGRQPILSAALAALLYVVVPGYVTGASTEYTPIVFGGLAVIAAMVGGVSLMDRLRASERLQARAAEPSPLQVRSLAVTEARS